MTTHKNYYLINIVQRLILMRMKSLKHSLQQVRAKKGRFSMNLTELQKEEIKKWEQENWFYAAKLQEEYISYEHYVDEVLLCISENKLTKV